MTKSNLSIANELTFSRRKILTFAASSFIATQMPWLAWDIDLPPVTEERIQEVVDAIDWDEVMNTVIGNTNSALSGFGTPVTYDEGSPEWIMERVLDHKLNGKPLPKFSD
jgi:hypothetical protein